ncbi:hypothetical protein GCM10010517_73410 [Streptosporangium fragile]|uniref:Uncharacterized protein n=1 Tax=Streptosporangium fragile TaxID=46186 RepID=A0ABN3WBM0_9ACTN
MRNEDRTLERLIGEFGTAIRQAGGEHLCVDFFRWCTDPRNPNRERWTRLMGLSSTHDMTVHLLRGSLSEPAVTELLDKSVTMNVYQTFEIVSDNIGFGLAAIREGDAEAANRLTTLVGFNEAMVAALGSPSAPARRLLDGIRPSAAAVPFLEHTLGYENHLGIVSAYTAEGGTASVADVNQATWPILVANMETCRAVADAASHSMLGGFVRDSLIARYAAVHALLTDPEMDWQRRLALSGDAILVAATLGYYVSFLLTEVPRAAEIGSAELERLVRDCLTRCGVIVRLLNDVGTTLLTDRESRSAWTRRLRDALRESGDTDLEGFLTRNLNGEAISTRLEKDLTYGELNLLLHGLHRRPAREAAPVLFPRLDDLAQVYADSWRLLEKFSAELDEALGDRRASRMLLTFVRFHEDLYRNSFATKAGEYSGV